MPPNRLVAIIVQTYNRVLCVVRAMKDHAVGSMSECNGFRLEGLERFFMVLDLTGRDRGGGVVLTKKYGKKL